jgi:hypothetical protein
MFVSILEDKIHGPRVCICTDESIPWVIPRVLKGDWLGMGQLRHCHYIVLTCVKVLLLSTNVTKLDLFRS